MSQFVLCFYLSRCSPWFEALEPDVKLIGLALDMIYH